MSNSVDGQAEVVLGSNELDADIDFFMGQVGMRLEQIFPADEPTTAVISGYGLRLRLDTRVACSNAKIEIHCRADSTPATRSPLVAPNGAEVRWMYPTVAAKSWPQAPSLVINTMTNDANWSLGRAGMQYRDLVPGRQSGRLIASHIRIPAGGPVPDYVHYHEVGFQMIYCYRGWVRLLYQDQGPAFVMQAGDCVLQPPKIRHRVLECSTGLEVIEVSAPAEHPTFAEHELQLPTNALQPDRDFSGQRFVHHKLATASWTEEPYTHFQRRNLGFDKATNSLASGSVLHATAHAASLQATHPSDLLFAFVLQGNLQLSVGDISKKRLTVGDSFLIPPGQTHCYQTSAQDLEVLEVRLPAD